MYCHVPMALLETVVLLHIMKVVAPDDDGPLHLHLGHHTGKDSSSDGYISGKRTLLVDVGSINGLKFMSTFSSLVS